ncbi:hypothetical protein BDV29DRAFT_153603 [Aspergillus leporis]|uniref:Uncharacterized protein n=1 Tax=Aspergillus leporis TaxID=41062 RepID=A0A5N5XEH4_9EURO|nr:hypothetical protein BDV29DRAFT_153603 [Aspergillus leporis]
MLSPSFFAVPRQAPPVRPSRSLEGLEKVIPPQLPQPHTRPVLQLDKPLPELPTKPLPETPSMEDSTAWSDDSSTDVSFDTRRQSDASMESYPVFVRSASDDLTDFAENSTVSIDRASPGKPNNKPGPSPLALTTLSVDHHERRPFLLAKRAAPNHYFREKKWDFFPELATPSELPSGYPNFPSNTRKQNSSRLNLSALDFTKKGSRWTASEKRTRTHDMRNSIRSYVQRRLSKHSVDKDKPKRRPRPSTAPSEFRENLMSSRKTASSNYSNYSDHGSIGSQENFLDLSDMKRLSVSTHSSVDENQKQLESMAFHIKEQQNVTIAPIQKHGSALWEKPGREKRISYRQKSNRSATSMLPTASKHTVMCESVAGWNKLCSDSIGWSEAEDHPGSSRSKTETSEIQD